MIKIIIDTNILLAKERIDIFSELSRICDFNYGIYILDKTLEELEGKKGSKLALSMVKLKNIDLIKTKKDKSVDDLLLDLASKDKGIIVMTQDLRLKRLLKEMGIGIITIRQGKYLKFVN